MSATTQPPEDRELLREVEIEPSARAIPDATQSFLQDGRSRFNSVYCFSFVPSNYERLWSLLDVLPRQRFCEWGSGFGIATGIAATLGFEAVGMEVDEPLAQASRRLLADHNINANILTQDYLTNDHQADLYFVYCWPSMMRATESHFEKIAPLNSTLLICHGQDDIRCKRRW